VVDETCAWQRCDQAATHAAELPAFSVMRQRPDDSQLFPDARRPDDAYDNTLIEAFWARLQTELLDRKRWKTRIELSTALFDYLENFHNRARRHSALGMLTPIEFERVKYQTANAA
jgi:transposase InsO family protein